MAKTWLLGCLMALVALAGLLWGAGEVFRMGQVSTYMDIHSAASQEPVFLELNGRTVMCGYVGKLGKDQL